MTDTIQQLHDIAGPLALSLGLDLWGIEIVSGQRAVVRVYVEGRPSMDAPIAETSDAATSEENFVSESPRGVTVDQCADLSRLLGLSLDVEDSIPGAYMLEVSSPGLDRIFFTAEQLATATGKVVEMALARPVEGFHNRRKFKGVLADVREGLVFLALDAADTPDNTPTTVTLAYDTIKKARLVYQPPEKALPGKASAGKNAGEKKQKVAKGKKNAATAPAHTDAPQSA